MQKGVSIYRIVSEEHENITNQSVKKCLNVSTGKNDDCDMIQNPYHFFTVNVDKSEKGDVVSIFSSFLGKCVGIDNDGKLVYNVGCDVSDSELLLHNNNLISKKRKCAVNENGKCKDFFFENVGSSHRIWWNVNAVEDSLSIGTMNSSLQSTIRQSNSLINTYSLPKVVKNNGKWDYQYTESDVVNYAYNILVNHSVPNRENMYVARAGYKSRKPKAIFIFGSSGVGKSTIIGKISKNLDNPTWISYDIPLERLDLFRKLSHLEEIGFPIEASDPTAYETFYRFAGEVEEVIRMRVVKLEYDLILESADIPKETQITNLIDNGYDLEFLYVTSDKRKKNMIERFQENGRIGKYDEEITKEDFYNFERRLSAIGSFSIKNINVQY